MSPSAPLSVIIPALDAGASLPATLSALTEGRALIREIIVADGGSRDGTSRGRNKSAPSARAGTPRGISIQVAPIIASTSAARLASGRYACAPGNAAKRSSSDH